MEESMSSLVLVHGCHLEAKGWEDIVFGQPNIGRLGRGTKALTFLGPRFQGDVTFYWGSGASEREGKKESLYTFDYVASRAHELPQFQGFDPYEVQAIMALMKNHSVFDTEAQSTRVEILGALTYCVENDIGEMIQISSPTHMPRCFAEALIQVEKNERFRNIAIWPQTADTDYPDMSPADVAIIEPSHRGDRTKTPFEQLAKRMVRLRKHPDEEANQAFMAIHEVLASFGE
jgi:hypothetical protein